MRTLSHASSLGSEKTLKRKRAHKVVHTACAVENNPEQLTIFNNMFSDVRVLSDVLSSRLE